MKGFGRASSSLVRAPVHMGMAIKRLSPNLNSPIILIAIRKPSVAYRAYLYIYI